MAFMTIGEILADERKKRGYTQEEIAKYLQMARGSYAKYEVGINTPTTENIIKLADLYNLTTDYLLGRDTKKLKGKNGFKISCDNCEFNMPGDGKMVCAGRTKEYGQETPIKGVDYRECWGIDFSQYCEMQDLLEKKILETKKKDETKKN